MSSPGSVRTVRALRASVSAGTTIPASGWLRAVSTSFEAQFGGRTVSLLQNAT